MPQVSLASLLLQETQANILAASLSIAANIGLPVTAWQPGDPTRSLYIIEAAKLEALESIVVGFIQSGFLNYAQGQWLIILARQVFNVTVPPATFATTTVTLTNTGGGLYDIDANDLSFTQSGDPTATYTNTSGGTLLPLGTLSLDVTADTAGSAGNAAPDDIDTLVTSLLGVTCTNPTAAVGLDLQPASTTIQQCQDKLGSLSPDGPAEAYSYVARTPALAGTPNITRVRVYPDSDTGDVLVYLAGASGGSSGGDVTLVTAAIAQWATPLTITPTVAAASNVSIAVTYSLWCYTTINQTSDQVQAAVLAALESVFSSPELSPIGGNIIPPASTGYFYQSLILSTILSVDPNIFRVVLSAPTTDTSLGNGDVAVLGTVTPTVNFVVPPND